ncbi:MAG: hypothetical protein JNJ54_00405 [Myxococcaceae bacterium]|nr:hypothetical protein [Myxococcaceae bacterium]
MMLVVLLVSCSGAKIAVPPVASTDKALVEPLNQVVADEVLARAPTGSTVLTSSDITAALANERQRQLLGCDSASSDCLTEVAAALSADEQVLTTVTVLGSSATGTQYVIEVRRLSGKNMGRLGAGLVEVCGSGSRLTDAVREAVAAAYGAPARASVGSRCAPTWTVPTMVSGVVLSAAAIAGVTIGLLTKFAFDAQQAPGSIATVSRADAAIAQGLFVGGLAAGVAGIGLVASSIVGLLWRPEGRLSASVSLGPHVMSIVLGGAL